MLDRHLSGDEEPEYDEEGGEEEMPGTHIHALCDACQMEASAAQKLHEALQKYGKHEEGCNALAAKGNACTCGFDTAKLARP
jgi:hypothetical protein